MFLTTGFGYLKEKATNKIRSKFVLPLGVNHIFDTNVYDVFEVADQTALDAITVIKDEGGYNPL